MSRHLSQCKRLCIGSAASMGALGGAGIHGRETPPANNAGVDLVQPGLKAISIAGLRSLRVRNVVRGKIKALKCMSVLAPGVLVEPNPESIPNGDVGEGATLRWDTALAETSLDVVDAEVEVQPLFGVLDVSGV